MILLCTWAAFELYLHRTVWLKTFTHGIEITIGYMYVYMYVIINMEQIVMMILAYFSFHSIRISTV